MGGSSSRSLRADFTLIGTTDDQDHKASRSDAVCTPEEQDYLCAFASRYFETP